MYNNVDFNIFSETNWAKVERGYPSPCIKNRLFYMNLQGLKFDNCVICIK